MLGRMDQRKDVLAQVVDGEDEDPRAMEEKAIRHPPWDTQLARPKLLKGAGGLDVGRDCCAKLIVEGERRAGQRPCL